MAKQDIVSAGVAAIQAGEVQVYSDQLGLAYDGGFTDGVASVLVSTGGGISGDQEASDIAVAVGAAVGPLNSQISDLQSQLSTITAGKGADDAVIQGLQSQVSTLQSSAQSLTDLAQKLSDLLAPPAPQSV